MIAVGIIAVIVAYLLGSISGAYIITRLATGKDIRQLGGGNAGARNVYREVGLRAAIPVAIIDIGKGITAVVLAEWLLGWPKPFAFGLGVFVLGAGLAVVAGHMWSIFLRFDGGNGLAANIGVLSILMTRELVIVLGFMLLLTIITHNPVMSLNISLLSLPISAGFLGESWLSVVFPILLILIMVFNFIPTARAALVKAGNKENLMADLLRRDQAKKESKSLW